MSTKDALLVSVRRALNDPDWLWMKRALEIAAGGSLNQLLRVYTEASHRGGTAPARPDLPLAGSPAGTPDSWPLHWAAEDAVRAALLLERARNTSGTFRADAVACYESGDTREQQSWVRAVWLLPDPQAFLPIVIDTCRTSILPLFESVACANPYPARFFPELNFNQMVLKALFNSVALSRIVGLSGRLNPELARMAGDYARERRAAARSVPADIALVTREGGAQEHSP